MNDDAAERESLDDALFVLHGEEGTGTIRRLLYAGYLVLIFGGVYGFNVLRAVLVTSDPQLVRSAVVSVWGVLALLAVLAGLVLAAWRAGRVRGPVVPPLPFIDTVVASALDRWLVLRERGLALLVGGVGGGLLVGALVGGAFAGAGIGGMTGIAGAVLGGGILGLVVALTWLAGQCAQSGARGVRGLREALRGIRIEDLRTHAVRTTHVGGAVLAGDLRAVRLDVAAPVTRARSVRLRPGGRYTTVVRRDLLGYRRSPYAVALGVLGLAGAFALTAVASTAPAAPVVLGIVAMLVAYFAFGALTEGVRLVADTAGTPPLFGLPFRSEALAHLVAPVVTALTVSLPVTAVVARVLGGRVGVALAACGIVVGILAGTSFMAAFRGSPPEPAFVPEVGPMMMVYWYARPLVLAAVSGGLFLAGLADLSDRTDPAGLWRLVLLSGAVLAAFSLAYGIYLARKLELGHRV